MSSAEVKAIKCPNHLLSKLHVRQDPNCKFLFTKGRVGKSIWQKPGASNFALYEPSKAEAEYNPLYDPHLKSFLMRKAQLDHLRKNNFITKNNEVVCSLKDFNEFRQCVHRSKTETEAANKRVEYEEHFDNMRLAASKMVFNILDKRGEKFRKIYKNNSTVRCKSHNPTRYGSVLEIMQRRKNEQESQKRNKFMKTIVDYYTRLNEIEQEQYMKRNQLKERTIYKNLDIIKKQTFVSEKNRRRQIQLKEAIIERDNSVQKKLAGKRNSTPKQLNVLVKCPMKLQKACPKEPQNFQNSHRDSEENKLLHRNR